MEERRTPERRSTYGGQSAGARRTRYIPGQSGMGLDGRYSPDGTGWPDMSGWDRAADSQNNYEREAPGKTVPRPERQERKAQTETSLEEKRGRNEKADSKKKKKNRGKEKKAGARDSLPEIPGTAKNMEEVSAVIGAMKFRRKLLGGVDELDVWRQLEKLQREYRSAYEAQQERNKALLKERDIQISQLKKQLVLGNYGRGVTNGQK